VLIAGEKEARATERNRRDGIPVHPSVVARLDEMGAKAGVGRMQRRP
jgi:LDH2 family malate/lactate/ureidoglycolate dehydrogenase